MSLAGARGRSGQDRSHGEPGHHHRARAAERGVHSELQSDGRLWGLALSSPPAGLFATATRIRVWYCARKRDALRRGRSRGRLAVGLVAAWLGRWIGLRERQPATTASTSTERASTPMSGSLIGPRDGLQDRSGRRTGRSAVMIDNRTSNVLVAAGDATCYQSPEPCGPTAAAPIPVDRDSSSSGQITHGIINVGIEPLCCGGPLRRHQDPKPALTPSASFRREDKSILAFQSALRKVMCFSQPVFAHRCSNCVSGLSGERLADRGNSTLATVHLHSPISPSAAERSYPSICR